MNREIGIVGDFHNSKTQSAIVDSIEHSNRELGLTTTDVFADKLISLFQTVLTDDPTSSSTGIQSMMV